MAELVHSPERTNLPTPSLRNGMHQAVSESRWSSGDRRKQHEFVSAVSPSMKALELAIANVASSAVPVLIMGEMGAGKRTLAHRLHQISRRKQDHCEEVDCRTLMPDVLLASGKANGESANCGTLLLNDI